MSTDFAAVLAAGSIVQVPQPAPAQSVRSGNTEAALQRTYRPSAAAEKGIQSQVARELRGEGSAAQIESAEKSSAPGDHQGVRARGEPPAEVGSQAEPDAEVRTPESKSRPNEQARMKPSADAAPRNERHQDGEPARGDAQTSPHAQGPKAAVTMAEKATLAAFAAAPSARNAAPAQKSGGQSAATPVAGAGQARTTPGALMQRLGKAGEAVAQRARAADVAEQVGRAMGRAIAQGEGKVTLRLAPEQLGHVRVDLAVRGRSVEATLTAETERARQLLGESVEQLRAALEARGLSVERIVLAEAAQDARTEGGFGAAADGEGGNAGKGAGGRGRGDGGDAQGGFEPAQSEWVMPVAGPFVLDEVSGKVKLDWTV